MCVHACAWRWRIEYCKEQVVSVFHGRIFDEFGITKVHNGVSNQVIDIHYGAEDWEYLPCFLLGTLLVFKLCVPWPYLRDCAYYTFTHNST